MIDRFGVQRYLQDSQKVHVDEYGTLWRMDLPDDEAIVVVQVTNSTPEIDGSFKDYWLRVPPTITRAREGIAWTFGLSEMDYQPEVMT